MPGWAGARTKHAARTVARRRPTKDRSTNASPTTNVAANRNAVRMDVDEFASCPS